MRYYIRTVGGMWKYYLHHDGWLLCLTGVQQFRYEDLPRTIDFRGYLFTREETEYYRNTLHSPEAFAVAVPSTSLGAQIPLPLPLI